MQIIAATRITGPFYLSNPDGEELNLPWAVGFKGQTKRSGPDRHIWRFFQTRDAAVAFAAKLRAHKTPGSQEPLTRPSMFLREA